MDTLLRFVLLTVDGQAYALPLEVVDHTLRAVEITILPGAPNVVEGIINIHGEIIPVVSIRKRLGLVNRSLEISDSLVVAHTRTRRLAIIAESVLGIIERSADAVVGTGEIFFHGAHPIEGVLKTNDGLVLIQDVGRFFSPKEELSLDLALERR